MGWEQLVGPGFRDEQRSGRAGSSWSALGRGMNDSVNALTISGSNVYAGGWFREAGDTPANYIARWDGSNWAEVGFGMNKEVWALAVSGSNLYAGGDFTEAGDTPANHIAKWDGSSWSALGSGMGAFGHIYALAVSNADVYAGGTFTAAGGIAATNIAKWNGSSWSAMGSGVNQPVKALVALDRDLYVGGIFTTAGGKAIQYIARAYLLSPPTLSVHRSPLPQGWTTVSWPSADTVDFTLEQADTPTAPANWVSNGASIDDNGTTKSVTLAL